MAKTANLYIRLKPEVKEQSERLFSQFGLTISDAVNIFLHQSLLVGGLPFDVRQPRYNHETECGIEEARSIMAGSTPSKNYASAHAFMEDLDKYDDI